MLANSCLFIIQQTLSNISNHLESCMKSYGFCLQHPSTGKETACIKTRGKVFQTALMEAGCTCRSGHGACTYLPSLHISLPPRLPLLCSCQISDLHRVYSVSIGLHSTECCGTFHCSYVRAHLPCVKRRFSFFSMRQHEPDLASCEFPLG